ncbi:MAG TPA: hypothetical protein VF111_08010 [Thermoanaerobaculia bacterium]
MKKPILLLLFLLAARASLACTEGSTIRVRYFNCELKETMRVRIAGQDLTLTQKGDYYEGELSGGQANPKFPIEIAGRQSICCLRAKLVPKQKRSSDCAVEYVVTCDTRSPGWAILAQTSTAEITFDFTSGHPDDFGTAACFPADVQKSGGGVRNLGKYDVVEVRVMHKGLRLVSFEVTLDQLEQGSLPLSKADLIQKIDEEKTQKSTSGPALGIIERRKTLLPDSGVTVVKQ